MGSYRLIRRLGVGGMGEIWQAEHDLLARPAALKLISMDALAVRVILIPGPSPITIIGNHRMRAMS